MIVRFTASVLVPSVAISIAVLGLASDASAYCRTASCPGGTGVLCTPENSKNCGIPIFWPSPCISFSMQQDGSAQVPLETARATVQAAFASWTNADCGDGEHPRLRIVMLGDVSCGLPEYSQEFGNANAIIFRDDEWPYADSAALALTTVTYNLETGEIRDADMELNSAEVAFTTADSGVQVDLLSVITHEVGHFLGLAHSADAVATMNKDYAPGSIGLRDLSADDIAGICAAYPPGDIPNPCDAAPRGGLQSECSTGVVEEDSCNVAAPGAPARVGSWFVVASAAALAALGRARRRRCSLRPTPRHETTRSRGAASFQARSS